MRKPRTVQPLPRYVRRKWLKSGSWSYFFEPPTWARKAGCSIEAEALGSDYESARDKAEVVLLPAFEFMANRRLVGLSSRQMFTGNT